MGGRTILFVSHNMAAVQSLCTRAILLTDGLVLCDHDDPSETIAAYSRSGESNDHAWRRAAQPASDAPLVFRTIRASLLGDQPRHQLRIVAESESLCYHAPAMVAFDVLDAGSAPIMQALPSLLPILEYEPGLREIEVVIDLPPLIPGYYLLTGWIGPHNTSTYDLVESALSFEVVTSSAPGRSYPHTRDHGHIVPAATLATLSRSARNS
jgi:lipopolysaccharide transport system ATP-binding protein